MQITLTISKPIVQLKYKSLGKSTLTTQSSALSNGSDQKPIHKSHFFHLYLFPEAQWTKHYSSPHFLISACI